MTSRGVSTIDSSSSDPGIRPALHAMYAGVVLTAIATVAPYADRATGNVLADHIRSGYPAFTAARINSAVTAWLVTLSVIGVLGIAGWFWTIRVVKSGRWWARWGATLMLVLGTGVALAALLVKDTSGDTGLAPLLGFIGVLPCLAGVAAVTMLWRLPWRRRQAR